LGSLSVIPPSKTPKANSITAATTMNNTTQFLYRCGTGLLQDFLTFQTEKKYNKFYNMCHVI
jgi:hypothetical protein